MTAFAEPHSATPSVAAGYAGAVVTVLIWATWVLATRHTASTSLGTVDIGLNRYGLPALVLAPVWLRTGLLPKGVSPLTLAVMVAGSGFLFFQVTASALQMPRICRAMGLLSITGPNSTSLTLGVDITVSLGLRRYFVGQLLEIFAVAVGPDPIADQVGHASRSDGGAR